MLPAPDVAGMERLSDVFHRQPITVKISFAAQLLESIFADPGTTSPMRLIDGPLRSLEDGYELRVLIAWLKREMKRTPREKWKRNGVMAALQSLAANPNFNAYDITDMLVRAGVQEVAVHRALSKQHWAYLVRTTDPGSEVMVNLARRKVRPELTMPKEVFPYYFRRLWRDWKRHLSESEKGEYLNPALARTFAKSQHGEILALVMREHYPVQPSIARELLRVFWKEIRVNDFMRHPGLPLDAIEWAIKECWGHDDTASVMRLQDLVKNPRTPERYLRALIANPDFGHALAQNPRLPNDMALTLWEVDTNPFTRHFLMKHPAIPAEDWRAHLVRTLEEDRDVIWLFDSELDIRRMLADPRMDQETWLGAYAGMRSAPVSMLGNKIPDMVAEFFFDPRDVDESASTRYRARKPAKLPDDVFEAMATGLVTDVLNNDDKRGFIRTLDAVLAGADGFPAKMLVKIYDGIDLYPGYGVRALADLVGRLGQQENKHLVAAIIDLHAETLVKAAFEVGGSVANNLPHKVGTKLKLTEAGDPVYTIDEIRDASVAASSDDIPF